MFPIEEEFSKKSKGRYGYKNARVEIETFFIVKWIGFTLDAEDLDKVIGFLEAARKFRDMEVLDRQRIGAE